jgi:hypothetical protein
MHRSVRVVSIRALAIAAVVALITPMTAAAAPARGSVDFATPLFGLGLKRGELFVADAGQGVVRYDPRTGQGSLVAELPGVTDVAPFMVGRMHATTGAPDNKLYRIRGSAVREVADLGAFEANVNPDGGAVDSNPFKVAALPGRRALVADAAANALLIVSRSGKVDWVATLPQQLVSTSNLKRLVECPDPLPGWEFACDLPRRIPAEPVATSIAVGPDGAYYVGELKGFPAPRNRSRIWRIEPGTLHAECGSSPDCSVVARGFTSIVDLGFTREGDLIVSEIDRASWLAVEPDINKATFGWVSVCDLGSWNCEVNRVRTPIGVQGTRRHVFATEHSLDPANAGVVRVT